ncbi:Uncharacterised protein [Vibrio cholerae]|nr:Uncharacterised protein [Vibrio cholerae]
MKILAARCIKTQFIARFDPQSRNAGAKSVLHVQQRIKTLGL